MLKTLYLGAQMFNNIQLTALEIVKMNTMNIKYEVYEHMAKLSS